MGEPGERGDSTGPLRIGVDRDRCTGAGMCALTAPEVFDQDEADGLVVLLRPEPESAHRGAARVAAGLCPAGAIAVDDSG
ncbi:ferredoxin [Streptomyces flavofungini]|uniref:ferredoxin n=1 Tax=Streptomyces flavofungini TaxID=68200 RepID=UPI003F820E70